MKNSQRSICPFCSMGCTLRLRRGTDAPYVGQEGIPALDYDPEGAVNRGSLCGKGNMALELLTHPERLDAPLCRRDGTTQPTSWDEALDVLAEGLARIRRADGPHAIGILAGPHLTNEEAGAVARIAHLLDTPNVDLAGPEDRVVLTGLTRSGASPERVSDVETLDASTATLIVGDAFTLAPCIAKPVLNARYDERRNILGVLGFWKSRTVLFGKPVIRCLPGRESAALTLLLKMALRTTDERAPAWTSDARRILDPVEVSNLEELAGLRTDDLTWILEGLHSAERSAVLFGCGFAETERLDLVAGLSALIAELTESRFLPLLSGPNAFGVQKTLEAEGLPGAQGMTNPEMLEAAGTGHLKALFAVGTDPVGASPGRVADDAAPRLPLLATTAPMRGRTADHAHVVLPSAAWGEKTGTVENAFGAPGSLTAALAPPGTARPDGVILAALEERLRAMAPFPPVPASNGDVRRREHDFFSELELHLRLERREGAGRGVGTTVLFPEFVASHAGDGWLTRPLSWSRHEMPQPVAALSPRHAATLGVREGEPVRVRSRDAEAVLTMRIEQHLADDVVLVSPHYPEVRRLTNWRFDPALRDLDLRPERVSVERLEEMGR